MLYTVAAEDAGLTGLWFEGQKHFPTALLERASERRLPLFEQAEAWLDVYFAGSEPGFSVSLRLCGTPFQQLVWQLLRDIPYGYRRFLTLSGYRFCNHRV